MGAASHFSLIDTPIMALGVLCHGLSIWPYQALYWAAERQGKDTSTCHSRVSLGRGLPYNRPYQSLL